MTRSPADAEALGKALAADLQSAIVKNPAYAPMTYERREALLRREHEPLARQRWHLPTLDELKTVL